MKIPTEHYEKFKKKVANNQANFFIHPVKECAKHFEIDYIEIRHMERRLRRGAKDDSDLWEGRVNPTEPKEFEKCSIHH